MELGRHTIGGDLLIATVLSFSFFAVQAWQAFLNDTLAHTIPTMRARSSKDAAESGIARDAAP